MVFPSNDKRGKVIGYYTRSAGDFIWSLDTSSLRVFRKNSPTVLSTLLSKFPTALEDASDYSVPDLEGEGVNDTVSDNVDTVDAAEQILKRFTAFQQTAVTALVPTKVYVCPQDAVPVRTSKVHAQFRGHLLKKMMRVQKILNNMVLFHCTTCNARFPTWHPGEDYQPDFELECLKTCSNDVHTWFTQPQHNGKARRHATLHQGLCVKCHRSLEKKKEDNVLQDVAVWSPANNWDPLFGLDVGAAYKEWQELSRIATVQEAMLVALCHMQVNVCFLRRYKYGSAGMTGFRTNIIAFPQDALELKALEHFWSNLQVHDVVNVRLTDDKTVPRRARVLGLQQAGIWVQVAETGETHLVQKADIEQRVSSV